MGDENPNAQIEANLLEGKGRYASAGTTLQDIKLDLDNIAAGLQSSWLGPACQDYQDKQGQLTTTVQSASDVLQKGSTSIGKMYDSYIEADEKQKQDKEVHETLEMFMGVFMIVTSLLGLIGPILEAADLLFGIEIEALDIGIEVGEVATDVAEDVAIEEVETLSSLDTLGDIDPLNEEIPDPIDNPPEAPPQDTPVDTPLTEDTPPNVEEPSGEPIQEPSKYDSGIDLSQDEQDLLGKLGEKPLEGPNTGKNLDDFLPPQPEEVQVNMVLTDNPAEFDPGQELNAPADDTVYGGHEFDDFDFDHEEFDPGQELNAPADDTVYGGHEFDGFDSSSEVPLGEHDPVNIPLGENPIEELTPLLESAPEGQNALTTIDEYNVQVQTKTMGEGDTSEYLAPAPSDAHGGTIILDADTDAGEMATHVVHEGVHANWENEGLTSLPWSTEENEYVENKIIEEADAFATEYEFTQNSKLTSSLPQGMQEAYDRGYLEGMQNYFFDHPDATYAELQDAGKIGARKEFAELLKHAKDNDGESYADMFQKHWRGYHPDDGGAGPSATT